jgi:hypothetical protein
MAASRTETFHGIRNKGQVIPVRDLDTARDRMRDWRERFDK